MSGVNVYAALMLVPLNLAAFLTGRISERGRERTVKCLCAGLLLFKTGEYLYYALSGQGLRLPVEFSAVTYFILPLILLLHIRRLEPFGVYAGLMAGLCYYLALLTAGDRLYAGSSAAGILISSVSHGILYICAAVKLGSREYDTSDWWGILLCLSLALVWAALLRPYAGWGDTKLFIYAALDAEPVRKLLPAEVWPQALPVYYILMALLVVLSVKGFFRLNLLLRRRYARIPAPASGKTDAVFPMQ